MPKEIDDLTDAERHEIMSDVVAHMRSAFKKRGIANIEFAIIVYDKSDEVMLATAGDKTRIVAGLIGASKRVQMQAAKGNQ